MIRLFHSIIPITSCRHNVIDRASPKPLVRVRRLHLSVDGGLTEGTFATTAEAVMAERPERSDGEIDEKTRTKGEHSGRDRTPPSDCRPRPLSRFVVSDDGGSAMPTDAVAAEKPVRETKKKSASKKTKKNDDESKNESIDCPVCLGIAVIPTRIPCGHVFCFLCVKGAARQRNSCPLCRQHIPVDFDKNPTVLEREEVEMFEDGFQWFYEGKNGWWQYEKRTSEEIEQNYKLNNMKFDLLICGTIYTIDLNRNLQYDRQNPNRRRRVKRENGENIAVKGVAGVH